MKKGLLVAKGESGLRIGGKLQWIHTLSSQKLTHLFVHPKSGKEALESEPSLLPKLTNWLVHDGWDSYFPFTNVRHAICGAHILRELQALIDRGRHWANQMHKFLLNLYHKTQNGTKALVRIHPFQKRFEDICYQSDLEEPPPSKEKEENPKGPKAEICLTDCPSTKTPCWLLPFIPTFPSPTIRLKGT